MFTSSGPEVLLSFLASNIDLLKHPCFLKLGIKHNLVFVGISYKRIKVPFKVVIQIKA